MRKNNLVLGGYNRSQNKALIGYNEIIVYLFIFNILNLNLKFTVKMYERNEW